MDQRGVGRSRPRVDCRGLRVLEARLLQRELPPEEEDRLWLDAVASCRDRLLRRGIDFSIFGSSQSAGDIDDLRRALGVEEWNIYGISYGTRLALTVARDHAEGVRSLVLDSVYPPEAQSLLEGPEGLALALERAWSGCEECAGTPDVLGRVVAALNQRPMRIAFVHPDTLARYVVVLDGDRLIDALVVGLSGHADVRKLAAAIEGIAAGDERAAAPLVRDYWLAMQDEDFSYPVNFSVECREEVPFNDGRVFEEANRFPLVARHERRDASVMQDICELWKAEPSPIDNQPIHTSAPTLILAGIFDPVTPVAWAERLARSLPKAQLLTVMAGHSVTDADPCASQVIAAFLDEPYQPPSADCSPRARSEPFVRP
jgi:pimeloyl-ACP methyl ester carboxylesterase